VTIGGVIVMQRITKFVNSKNVKKKWYLIDADGVNLGRLAVKIANKLRGKDKAIFTPHLGTGDYVVVINAEKVALTGKKNTDKIYEDYSGYMSGRKLQTADVVRTKKPERLLLDAVKGMVPKNRLGRAVQEKLYVYAGPEHPHEAQNPELIKLV